jgi:hypothetical protein
MHIPVHFEKCYIPYTLQTVKVKVVETIILLVFVWM